MVKQVLAIHSVYIFMICRIIYHHLKKGRKSNIDFILNMHKASSFILTLLPTFGSAGNACFPQHGQFSVGYVLIIFEIRYSLTGRRDGLGTNGGSLFESECRRNSVMVLTHMLTYLLIHVSNAFISYTHFGFLFKGF